MTPIQACSFTGILNELSRYHVLLDVILGERSLTLGDL